MRQNLARRHAMGLVEAMISLSITSMLLVAVAAAFSASSAAISNNDRFFRASQAARVSMNQIQTAIRRCQACQIPSTSQIDLITFDSKNRSYMYSSGDKKLKLVTNDITSDPDYTLASNVTSASFVADSEPDPNTGVSRVVRVTITLVVKVGNDEIRLSGSAVPRRAVVY
jgi:type II secretory pathway pseudopilin PulG